MIDDEQLIKYTLLYDIYYIPILNTYYTAIKSPRDIVVLFDPKTRHFLRHTLGEKLDIGCDNMPSQDEIDLYCMLNPNHGDKLKDKYLELCEFRDKFEKWKLSTDEGLKWV